MSEGQRYYKERDAEQILQIASKRSAADGSMSRDQLLAAATELGITDEALAAAEREYFESRQLEENRVAFRHHVRQEFWSHFGSYVVINAGLVAFDVLRDGSLSWALWPLVAWGIAVLIHAWHAFVPNADQNAEFDKWVRRRRKREENRALPREVEQALDDISDRLDLDDDDEEQEAIQELRTRLGMTRSEAKDALDRYVRE